MSNSTPQETLAWHIDRFITDSGLAHDFVKGDENLMVQGEAGAYPSLAKLAKDAKIQIDLIAEQRLGGLVVRKYTFAATQMLNIKHDLNTELFSMTIMNDVKDILHAPFEPIDSNEFTIHFTEPESGIVIIQFFVD